MRFLACIFEQDRTEHQNPVPYQGAKAPQISMDCLREQGEIRLTPLHAIASLIFQPIFGSYELNSKVDCFCCMLKTVSK